jgi:hypothetical protein
MATKTKQYRIDLSQVELDFVIQTLKGINEFLKFLHDDSHNNHIYIPQQRHGCKISPEDLADKIFVQTHDVEGELLSRDNDAPGFIWEMQSSKLKTVEPDQRD